MHAVFAGGAKDDSHQTQTLTAQELSNTLGTKCTCRAVVDQPTLRFQVTLAVLNHVLIHKKGPHQPKPTRCSSPARSATRPAPGAQRTRARCPQPGVHASATAAPGRVMQPCKLCNSLGSTGAHALLALSNACTVGNTLPPSAARGARQHDRGRQRRHIAQALAPAQRAAWRTRPTAALARPLFSLHEHTACTAGTLWQHTERTFDRAGAPRGAAAPRRQAPQHDKVDQEGQRALARRAGRQRHARLEAAVERAEAALPAARHPAQRDRGAHRAAQRLGGLRAARPGRLAAPGPYALLDKCEWPRTIRATCSADAPLPAAAKAALLSGLNEVSAHPCPYQHHAGGHTLSQARSSGSCFQTRAQLPGAHPLQTGLHYTGRRA